MKKLTTVLLATALTLPTAAAFADDHEVSNTGSANTEAGSTMVEGGSASSNETGKVEEDMDTQGQSGSANTEDDSMLVDGGSAESDSASEGMVTDDTHNTGVSPGSGSANTGDDSMTTD